MTRDRQTVWVAVLLGALTTIGLATQAPSIGYTRDEGIYFDASRRYGTWLGRLVESPREALGARSRDRTFRHNREHPPTMKLAAAASARVFGPSGTKPDAQPATATGTDGLMSEGSAMRLPAQLLTGFGVALLFWIGATSARRQARTAAWCAGAVASGWLAFAPRVAFHGSLHAFDVPIAVATLVAVLAYRRARSSWRWSIALAVIVGIAITIKHNALFIPFVLYAHHAMTLLRMRRRGARISPWALAPPAFVAMAIITPLVSFALWPWSWTDPSTRIAEYVAFHSQHSYYNMEFLGRNYNRPPLPVSFPFVMTLATVSSVLVGLTAFGFVVGPERSEDPDPRSVPKSADEWTGWRRGQPSGWPHFDRSLVMTFALFPLVLIAVPTVPIFGGTKHWLTAYPFMAWSAAWGWSRILKTSGLPPRAIVVASVFVLGPAAWSTVHGHAQGLSQYSPLVGGARGAANRGLNRGFWGHAALPILEAERSELSTGGARAVPVYPHDIHALAEQQYRREGRWPAGWTRAPVQRAQRGLIFHERHMLSDEVAIWNAFGTASPVQIVTLDDVPLTSFYVRPGSERTEP